MAKKHRVEFIREETIQVAPKTPGRGGSEAQVFPVGTILEVNDASLNFWRQRGCIKVLRDKPSPLNAFGTSIPTDEPCEVEQWTKKSVKAAFEAALRAHDDGDNQSLIKTLSSLDIDNMNDALFDLPDDSHIVLSAAIEDSKNGVLHGSLAEIIDAIRDAHDVTLAPSQRKRVRTAS